MIILECYLDEFIVKCLGFPQKRIKHEGSKGNVIKKLENENIKNAIGIIDEDPLSANPKGMLYYKEFEALNSVKLFTKEGDKHKRLIEIQPRLEDWIIKRAKVNNIDLKNYNIPDDPKELHKKGPNLIKRNMKFQGLIDDLLRVDIEVIAIKNWIEEALKDII